MISTSDLFSIQPAAEAGALCREQFLEALAAWLGGSVADGMHHPGSDLSASPCFSTAHRRDFGALPIPRNHTRAAHCDGFPLGERY